MYNIFILCAQIGLTLFMGAVIAYGFRDAFQALRDYWVTQATLAEPSHHVSGKAAVKFHQRQLAHC